MSEIRQAVEEICERFGFRVVDGEDAGNLAYDFNGRVMDFVIQAENVDGNWADWIAFGEHEGWPELISCDTDRANIWLYQPGFHHSKIMMVDGQFCTVGSTNLDARSLRYDYEVNALIINKQVTKELQDMFIRDTKKSVLLTPDEWNKFRTGWQKFRGWFAQLFTPFM